MLSQITWIAAILLLILSFKLYQVITCGKCTCDTILNGKLVIVTGANSGIGYETAKDFARRGAKVILACRNDERGKAARDKIILETGNNNVIYKNLNLASLESVRKFVEEYKDTEVRLDILVNNAGAATLGNKHTADGIVIEMQVNYFGPFLLTTLLIPLLKNSTPSRIINVSSVLHFLGRVDFKNINKEGKYGDLMTYCNSKLCNVLFTKELAKRLENTGVVANSLHPGSVETNIYRHQGGIVKTVVGYLNHYLFKNSREGAQTSIHLAVSANCEKISGRYFLDCHEGWTSWKVREGLSSKLWEYSEILVKLKSEEILDS